MRIGTVFSVIIYAAALILLGIFLIGIATAYIPFRDLTHYISYIYNTPELKLYLGTLGGLLIVLSILLFHIALGHTAREKKIVIKGKDGITQISLYSPVENIVKDVSKELGTIIDSKQDVYKWKKGIRIDVRLAMRPGINIKDVSDTFRSKVIEKVRQVIGIEWPVEVNVFVLKVSDGRKKQATGAKAEPNFTVPYREMDV